MGKLTVHSIVRNEPFIYYSIMSVYDFVDVILLYDTGSTDNTVSDIQQLLDLDKAKKIKFEQIPVNDETGWSKRHGALRFPVSTSVRRSGYNMASLASLRQRQIDQTETDFFLVLDGDEVYYRKTIRKIGRNAIYEMPSDKFVGFVNMDWFVDLEHKFAGGKPSAPSPIGRLFRRAGASIIGDYPNEYHSYNGRRTTKRDSFCCRIARSTPSVAHFETYLKPWRQTLVPAELQTVNWADLPEVVVENDYFCRRFMGKS